jgi:hypothetical protein
VADRSETFYHRSGTHRGRGDHIKSGRNQLETRPFGWRDNNGRVRLIVTRFGQVFSGSS